MSELSRGLYETLVTEALETQLDRLATPLAAVRGPLRSAETADRIALHVGRVIREPLIPLLDTTLLTNAPGEPRVGHQVLAELHSADRIDVIMAFIRRSGIAPLLSALRAHCSAGRSLRVLTRTRARRNRALWMSSRTTERKSRTRAGSRLSER